jgi:hypothetical protein
MVQKVEYEGIPAVGADKYANGGSYVRSQLPNFEGVFLFISILCSQIQTIYRDFSHIFLQIACFCGVLWFF